MSKGGSASSDGTSLKGVLSLSFFNIMGEHKKRLKKMAIMEFVVMAIMFCILLAMLYIRLYS